MHLTRLLAVIGLVGVGCGVLGHNSATDEQNMPQINGDAREAVERLVRAQETKFFRGVLGGDADVEPWITLSIEPHDPATFLMFNVYSAHNTVISPPVERLVAVGEDGSAYRLRGFAENDYTDLVTSIPGPFEAELALEIARGFFALVEDWKPGVLETAQDVSEARQRITAALSVEDDQDQELADSLDEPVFLESGVGFRIRAFVFDAHTLRTEKITVLIDPRDGVLLEGREVLIDSKSFEL
jgi:hypothetical protein